jgi:hypothetical protein
VTLAVPADDVYLIDILDRVLAGGVVLSGDVTLSLAGVDLIQISLRALISSVSTVAERGADVGANRWHSARVTPPPCAGEAEP